MPSERTTPCMDSWRKGEGVSVSGTGDLQRQWSGGARRRAKRLQPMSARYDALVTTKSAEGG